MTMGKEKSPIQAFVPVSVIFLHFHIKL